jgi:hypothetical protein
MLWVKQVGRSVGTLLGDGWVQRPAWLQPPDAARFPVDHNTGHEEEPPPPENTPPLHDDDMSVRPRVRTSVATRQPRHDSSRR